jgi:anti-anti-sigma factor
MQIGHKEIGPDIGLIYLKGRLDIMGVQKIELKFTAFSSTQRRSVIVDLSEVELMNSVGLGMLISNAKTLKAHGKKMVLLKPDSHVETVITMAGVDELLPIEHDLTQAIARIKQ